MAPRGGYEDEELTISLSQSQIRRRNHADNDRPADRNGDGNGHDDASATGPSHYDEAATPHDKKKQEQRIGAYRIERTLGEGSFGKVKLATHNVTGQKVALKIIGRKKLISRDMAGRVEREIEYLQLLRHPHIIKL